MSTWRVRREGAENFSSHPNAQGVMDGVRDGIYSADDDVKGPDDTQWQAIELHPQFAEACDELEPPAHRPHENDNLDMNPMIDVALVLLIFFILTTSYATLRRSIDLPELPAEDKGKQAKTQVKQDLRDRIFKVRVYPDEMDKPVVEIEEKKVGVADAKKEFEAISNATGRREMYLDIHPDITWGTEALIYDAAKGANIRHIHMANKRR